METKIKMPAGLAKSLFPDLHNLKIDDDVIIELQSIPVYLQIVENEDDTDKD